MWLQLEQGDIPAGQCPVSIWLQVHFGKEEGNKCVTFSFQTQALLYVLNRGVGNQQKLK